MQNNFPINHQYPQALKMSEKFTGGGTNMDLVQYYQWSATRGGAPKNIEN